MIKEIIFVLCALMGQIGSIYSDCKMCRVLKGERIVCGADGNTYLNRCYMRCNGVEKAYKGKCENCSCTKYFKPVCAQSGTTFMNACEANCRNDSVAHSGKCRGQKCRCGDEYSPVCGANGRTYQNECKARCQGVNKEYSGVCEMCLGGYCRSNNSLNVGLHSHEHGRYVHYGFYN